MLFRTCRSAEPGFLLHQPVLIPERMRTVPAKNDKTCFFPSSLPELLWSLEESWDVDESATIAFSCMNQVSRLPFPKRVDIHHHLLRRVFEAHLIWQDKLWVISESPVVKPSPHLHTLVFSYFYMYLLRFLCIYQCTAVHTSTPASSWYSSSTPLGAVFRISKFWVNIFTWQVS